jgi:hypothetical protein
MIYVRKGSKDGVDLILRPDHFPFGHLKEESTFGKVFMNRFQGVLIEPPMRKRKAEILEIADLIHPLKVDLMRVGGIPLYLEKVDQ